jgi:hypothetical protein
MIYRNIFVLLKPHSCQETATNLYQNNYQFPEIHCINVKIVIFFRNFLTVQMNANPDW